MNITLDNLSPFIIPPALSLLVGLSIGLISIIKGKLKTENVLFFIVCISWSLLNIAFVSHYLFKGNTELILNIERGIHFFWVYLPAVNMVYFYYITNTKSRYLIPVVILTSSIMSIFTITPGLRDYYWSGLYEYSWGYIAKGGIAFQFMSFYGSVAIIYFIIFFIRKLRTEKNQIIRLKLKYILLSFIISSLLTLTNVPAMFGVDFYPMSTWTFIPLSFLAYGILSNRLMDIKSVLHVTLVWAALSSLIIIPNILIFIIGSTYVKALSTPVLFFVASVWFLVNYLYLKKVQPLIDQLFNRRKYNLRNIEASFIENIASLTTIDDLVALLIDTMKNSLSFKRAEVVICHADTSMPDGPINCSLEPEIKTWIVKHNHLVDRDMIASRTDYAEVRTGLLAVLGKYDAKFMVPIILKDELIAMLILPDKLNLQQLNPYEVQFINNIRNGAAIALENSLMFNDLSQLNLTLERKVEERTVELQRSNERLQELDKIKSNFFANISHEIRTPLTLILSPIESALQGDYKKGINDEFLQNIQRNAIRLLKLINNLLDFSKIEAGMMGLKIKEVNIVSVMRNYIDTVQSSAESKGVELQLETVKETINLFVDIDKIDKIAMNIFSNALKFTDRGGRITINLRDDEKNCYIAVHDTGIGIPPDKINTIFDRFSQVDISSTRKYEGTGIGLALAKELVELHDGRISVTSMHIDDHPEDHGSEFIFTLPKGKEHLSVRDNVEFISGSDLDESVSDQRRFIGEKEMVELRESTFVNIKAENKNENNSSSDAHLHHINILVVEDNPDMRSYLTLLLEERYNVHFAVDGKDGLDKAQELQPDLIVTDVMMPVMNGYQMTQKIKEDDKLNRTPILMLTAKADISQKIEGLEYGADDYLTKPFNSKELLVRIKTLLKTREYEKVIEERQEEINDELRIARLLQQKLLPESIPEISGYRSHVVYIPMDMVGGDFYDFKANDKTIELFIADVSGHGLPGAFISMITKMAFESIVERKSTNSVLYILNDIICRSTVENNYVTVFYCIIDRSTKIMRYGNAGHFPPLIYRPGTDEFIELKAKGNPLGWFKNVKIEEKEIELRTGDRIFLYTDGITECANQEGLQFGDDGFKDYIKSNMNLQPEKFNESLLEYMKNYSNRDTFDDDLCLMVVDVL